MMFGWKKLIFFSILIGIAFLPVDSLSKNGRIESIVFDETPVNVAMLFLNEQCGFSIVVSDSVNRKITTNLKDVSCQEALEIIAKGLNLRLELENGVYYLKEQVPLENIPLITKTIVLKYAKSQELVSVITPLLSQRGKISADAHSNSIVLTDIEKKVNEIINVISELDTRFLQVVIEAKIIQANNKDIENLGIDWTVGEKYTGNEASLATLDPLSGIGGVIGQIKYSRIFDRFTLSTILGALLGKSKGELIAQPTIVSRDNSQAKIEMGSRIPIKTLDPSGNIRTEYVDVGTKLIVTPHVISSDASSEQTSFSNISATPASKGEIMLDIYAERSTYEPSGEIGVIIHTQNASSRILVKNGETIVIGGLTSDDKKSSEQGIPVLSQIPILGHLFKYSSKTNEKIDLLIFITPTIVEEGSVTGLEQLKSQVSSKIGENNGRKKDYILPQ